MIFDNDPGDDEAGNHRRDALQAVGIIGTDQDMYVETDDWLIEEEVAVFGTDFETILRGRLEGYSELETEARAERGVSAKPFIARWVAERIAYEERAAGWSEFHALADALRELLQEARPGEAADEREDEVGAAEDLDDWFDPELGEPENGVGESNGEDDLPF